MNNVPCGDCHLCCKGGSIKLETPDFSKEGKPRFIVMPETDEDGRYILGYREEGCVYLFEGKCTIHNDKPVVCQRFDCRQLAMIFSKKQMIDLVDRGIFPMTYWERGKQLILAQAGV